MNYFSLSPSQQCDNNKFEETSSLSLSSTNLTACGPSNNQESLTKTWSCSNCTYLNWIKATRCVQCATIKQQSPQHPQHQQQQQQQLIQTQQQPQPMPTDVNTILNNDVNEQMKSLNIAGSDPDLVAAVGNRISPMGSATNLSGSRTNLGAGARISPVEHKGYPILKWSCSVSMPGHSYTSEFEI